MRKAGHGVWGMRKRGTMRGNEKREENEERQTKHEKSVLS
jgi:hypothetical protein